MNYSWTIIKNLIALWIVISIFDNAYSNFETIVSSLLVIIYLSIDNFLMWYGLKTTQTLFALDTEFKRIRELLKDEESEYEKEQIQEAKERTHKDTVKLYINGAFDFIMYLIALWHLFSVL